jgi:hypothetical protein
VLVAQDEQAGRRQFDEFKKSYPAAPAYEVWQDDHVVLFSNLPPSH